MVRLDLFLKASRLVKRRTVARELCDADRVLVNGLAARPAKTVRPGDSITLLFPTRSIELEILALPERAQKKAEAETAYRIIEEQRVSQKDEP